MREFNIFPNSERKVSSAVKLPRLDLVLDCLECLTKKVCCFLMPKRNLYPYRCKFPDSPFADCFLPKCSQWLLSSKDSEQLLSFLELVSAVSDPDIQGYFADFYVWICHFCEIYSIKCM